MMSLIILTGKMVRLFSLISNWNDSTFCISTVFNFDDFIPEGILMQNEEIKIKRKERKLKFENLKNAADASFNQKFSFSKILV